MGKRISRVLPYGLVICAAGLLLWISGYPPVRAFEIVIESTWSSPSGFALVLAKTMPLILTGLAVVIPFRAGLFNIGGEGQMYLGGISSAVVGALDLGLPPILHVPLSMAVGVGAGCIWGALAGYLRASRGVHEVIGTILLNFVALHLVNYLVLGPLSAEGGAGRTSYVQQSAVLWSFTVAGGAPISVGLFLSLVCAFLCQGLLYRTQVGWETRAIGENPIASRYAGISINRYTVGLMGLAGGLAGLAGALETAATHHTFHAKFAPGYGFDGIAVAFLARAEPWAVIPAALFLSTLRTADSTLQFEIGVPKEMVLILEGALIVLIAVLHQHERRRQLREATS